MLQINSVARLSESERLLVKGYLGIECLIIQEVYGIYVWQIFFELRKKIGEDSRIHERLKH